MKHFFKICKDHISIILPSIIFFIIAVVNSYSNIGLLLDGPRQFFSALMVNDVFYGKENISNYIYIVRYFPSILPQFSVFFSILIGITDVKTLLTIFTFVIYCSPIIFLIILYSNIPKDKKNIFEIILLSFLISAVYMKYFILTESFLTTLFLWTIFVVYFYIDLDKLKTFNLLTLIIFSIFSFSSHPNVVVFIPILLSIGIFKYLTTKNIKLNRKIILISSFVILIIAFVFNIYCIIHTVSTYDDYWKFKMLKDLNFICFISSILFVIFFSFLKIKNNRIIIIIITMFSFIIFYTVINIPPIQGVWYRMINLYIMLLFIFLLIYISIFKVKIEYGYIKIINMVLITALLISTLIYANKNNDFNSQIVNYMSKNKKIPIGNFMRDDVKNKNDMYSAILFVNIFPNPNNCNIEILSNHKYHTEYINDKRFKKFGIDISKIIVLSDK